jgi:signal transduction histidine kinase
MTSAAAPTYIRSVSDPATSPLATLNRETARRSTVETWLRPVGPVLLLAAAWSDFYAHSAPSLHGRGLAVSAALAAFAFGGLAGLATRQRSGLAPAVAVVILLAGSAALFWLQPGGTAVLGLFLGVYLLIRLVPRRWEIPVTCLGAAAVAAAAATGRSGSAVPGFLGAAAIVSMFVTTFFARRLREANEQAEGLLTELEHTRDAQARAAGLAERQRLAREMHDVLAHSLSGLLLQLEGARMLAAGDPADPRLVQAIERAHHLGSSGLDEARRAIATLRDDELPGPERLPELAAQFAADHGVPCEFTQSGQTRELSSEVRLTVYRVAQEALTNITKHAAAERVRVELAYLPDAARLTVEDFPSPDRAAEPAEAAEPGQPASLGPTIVAHCGYGLAGMRERAELLGGTLTAGPTGTGFRVELMVPA